jgi:uncharacterized protein YggE
MRRIVALAPLLFLTAAPIMTHAEDDKPETRTISVTGQGKISAVPNVADVNLGVVTQGETAREALSANTEKMAALHKVLKERGVASKDIQTTNLNVSPRYSQPPQPTLPGRPQTAEFTPKIVGYDVTNTVTITARDLDKFGDLLDAVVTAGANQMHGISFRIDAPESLLDEARKHAMADARHKADLLAGEAGVVVGPPISIIDSGDSSPPPPRPMMGRAMKAMAAPVPIAAGEQELSVTVHVVYELKSPKS